jgi:hypothetical protein
MDQTYQTYSDDNAGLPPVEELPPAKKRPSIILIVVVVLLLLCCCCLLFTALMYFWLGDIITDALEITQRLAPTLFSV